MTPTPAPPDAMPWTASGRALLQALKFRWRTHILAIEAEARAPFVEALRELDESLDAGDWPRHKSARVVARTLLATLEATNE